jgi:hypothetical protein
VRNCSDPHDVHDVHEVHDVRTRRTAPHLHERMAQQSALTQTDKSNGEKGGRRYGSSEATSSVRTAMKARAEMELWRRTERRDRIVKTDRKRRNVRLPLLPSAMAPSARGQLA